MGQSQSVNTKLFLFIPQLFMTSVVAFGLANHFRVSNYCQKSRLLGVSSSIGQIDSDIHRIGAQLHNPNNHNITAFEDSYSLYLQIMKSDIHSKSNYHPIKGALNVLSDALRIFGPECVVASYNGGKDAVAIMHLLRAALAAYSVEHATLWRPKLMYFSHEKEFPEVEELVFDTARRYDLELVVSDEGFVKGLERSVEDSRGKPLAFVLGTRKGDPNCGDQEVFAPSSDWMPPFMRVNPILSWTYGQVWSFLADFKLPYCSLYDQGYTSLGNIDNTDKNPALRTSDGRYLPASALIDYNLERAGRVKIIAGSEVVKLARQAVCDTGARLQSAKTVSIIYLQTPKNHWSESVLDGMSVKSTSICSLIELQEEVGRQCSLYDFILVDKGEEAGEGLQELLVNTTAFGVQPPVFYSNVLLVPSISTISSLIGEGILVAVNGSVDKIDECVKRFSTEEGHSVTTYAGFSFLVDACIVKLRGNDTALTALVDILTAAGLSSEVMEPC